jgi:hypothetical protein
MKTAKLISMLLVIVMGAMASLPALAQRHGGARIGLGITFGFPLYYTAPYYYYPPPYYYYPPPAYYYPPVVTQPPQTYIEKGAPEASPGPPQGYWHYCAESDAYYPYVKQCPGGWQRVPAQPPPG